MKSKDYTISSIRLISTLLIVLLHIFQMLEYRFSHLYIATQWTNLALVLFFSISAYLYSSREIEKDSCGKWLLHRYMEISIPASLNVILLLILYTILSGFPSKSNLIASLFAGLGLNGFFNGAKFYFNHYWFLTYILFFYLSLPLVQKLRFITESSEIKFWSIMLISTIICQTISFLLPIEISWGILLRFYLPYAIYKRYKFDSMDCRKVMTILTFISLLTLPLICYVRYLVKAGFLTNFSELAFIYYQTLSGTVLFYWLYFLFKKIRINKAVLSISDKYSYSIYLSHYLFIGYNSSIIRHIDNIPCSVFISLLLTALASIVLVAVSNPINKLVNNLIFTPKNKQ